MVYTISLSGDCGLLGVDDLDLYNYHGVRLIFITRFSAYWNFHMDIFLIVGQI